MANRMKIAKSARPKSEQKEVEDSQDSVCSRPTGPLSILTTGLWKRENIVLRKMELAAVRGVDRWFTSPQEIVRRQESMRQFIRTPLAKQSPDEDRNKSLTAWWNRI